MKTSHHPNIVQYMDSYIVAEQLWVVMEFMGGGCLTEVLEQYEHVKLTEPQIALACREVRVMHGMHTNDFFFFFQTLKGLVYIHDMHRIHRDIKSDNILLSETGEIKIGASFYST
jgi:serine/threonine protein kinase